MVNKHVAVKCTYNDGGEGDFVGFAGTCTEKTIKENIINHVWCGNDKCDCKIYYDNGFVGEKPNSPCMESELFRKWVYGAGWFHNGPKAGEPKRAHIEAGGIALLTTRFPGDSEKERRIVGLYKIGKVTTLDGEETKFYADQDLKLRLPFDEARELYFWDYYTINATAPSWKTGLLRYLHDAQVKKVLEDLIQTVRSNSHREIIKKLLCDVNDADINSVIGLRKAKVSRAKTVLQKRKYGPGGEGDNHKRLKEWIAKYPHAIGLKDVRNCEVEYSFCSGDTVDLLFERKNRHDVVVEIETDIPLPGAHQAIKYRALRCAEKNYQLTDARVKSVLVAWEIPQDVKKFCELYNIAVFEIKK